MNYNEERTYVFSMLISLLLEGSSNAAASSQLDKMAKIHDDIQDDFTRTNIRTNISKSQHKGPSVSLV